MRLYLRHHAMKVVHHTGPRILPLGDVRIGVAATPQFPVFLQEINLRLVVPAIGYQRFLELPASVGRITDISLQLRPGEIAAIVFSDDDRRGGWILRWEEQLRRGHGLRLDMTVTVRVSRPFKAWLSAAAFFPQFGRGFGRVPVLAGHAPAIKQLMRRLGPYSAGVSLRPPKT